MRMKKKWLLSWLILPSLLCQAQERTWLSTDRYFYAAGETVHCSAFCRNETGSASVFSGIAYVELYTDEGTVATAKIALADGRGAGSLILPKDLPTGNYRLSAYTALGRDAEHPDFDAYARTISVYNTGRSARKDVRIVENLPGNPVPEDGPVRILAEGETFFLQSPEEANVSISVWRDGGFPDYDTAGPAAFLAAPSAGAWKPVVTPEFDGEILYATVTGPDGQPVPQWAGRDLYLGSPGSESDIYAAILKADGEATFYTANIFGDKDMALSLKDGSTGWQIRFRSPFIGLHAANVPALSLSPSMEPELVRLGVAMQVTEAFDADTLYEHLPLRNLSFVGDSRVRYALDDYTRFATMQEVFTEILPDLRARRGDDGKMEIKVRCQNRFNQVPVFQDGRSLMLLDGVPILDHDIIWQYDPMLVKTIDIFPYDYVFGNTSYAGVANFITYKGDMPTAKLGDEVKIIDFQGVSYPVAITEASFPEGYPDLRQTLCWQPLVTLAPGESLRIPVRLPEGPGTWVVRVEGFTRSGQPVSRRFTYTRP